MSISYQKFLNECMLEFAKKILTKICTDKLQKDQVLYISYRTDHPAVVLSAKIRERYPSEITIVMQYQFENLSVKTSGISLTVSFDGIKENIYIPFESIIHFTDPSSGYNLKFINVINKTEMVSNATGEITSDKIIVLDKFRKPTKPV